MNKIYLIFVIAFWSVKNTIAQTYAKNGMVVSDSRIASDIGIQILKQGGNAIDAAIATAFALEVTFPQAGNIGGGGFMLFSNAKGKVTSIDFRETAPIKSSAEMFLNKNKKLIAGSNHKGIKSIGVPGTVAGLWFAHQKYGKLSWAKLVQPAIHLAENGILLSYTLASHAKKFASSEDSPKFLKNFYRNKKGKLLSFGENWKQPALANTLKLIKNKGKDGFYKGAVAEEIERYMKKHKGIITKKDLLDYKAVERKPLIGKYKDFYIYSMAPPSSGGVALIEMMNIMEQAERENIKFNSASYVHLLAEVMRRAFADRAAYLGDPDFNPKMDIAKLISKDFAKKKYRSIDMKKASKSSPTKFGQLYDGANTTHISVMDKMGNAVSLTYTLEQSYGSGMGSETLGFIFNDEMGDFNPVPGQTNKNGLIGTPPNLIQPKKRMLSSMTPTIVMKNKKPVLVIGSPGGRSIINTVFQTLLCHLKYGMDLKNSIESMKIHHQWLPDKIFYEKYKLSPDIVKDLQLKGHSIESKKYLGKLMGITFNPFEKIYVGVSDSSSPDGAAVGY